MLTEGVQIKEVDQSSKLNVVVINDQCQANPD